MQRACLLAKTRRAYRPCSKASSATGAAENLLQQKFTPPASTRCWAGDITCIRTTSGWSYLAVWMDLFSRRVVGWSLGTFMKASLVLEALNRAPCHRPQHHSRQNPKRPLKRISGPSEPLSTNDDVHLSCNTPLI